MQVLERLAVKALAESINRLADDVVVLILVSRVVAGSAQAVDLGRVMPKRMMLSSPTAS